VVSGVGFFEATKKPEVKKVTVPIADLPSEFEGFTIVQLSDVHVGQTIRGDFVDTIVGVTNDLKADLVVLTGDLIDGSPSQLAQELKSFARLQSTHGTVMIPGNHEYYWDLESWLLFWKQMGVKTLANEHTVIEKNNKHLVVAGVHDYSANRVPLATTRIQKSLCMGRLPMPLRFFWLTNPEACTPRLKQVLIYNSQATPTQVNTSRTILLFIFFNLS